MKTKLSFLLLPFISLVSCSSKTVISRKSFYFDTYTEIRLYEGKEENAKYIEKVFSKIDQLTDNYNDRGVNNIYKVNSTNESLVIDPMLYELLELSFSTSIDSLEYFDPLCGSLSKKWKEALNNNQVLSESVINEQLNKMSETDVMLTNENMIDRIGSAEIDLGAVAKGYALDKAKDYLNNHNLTKYLIDAGSSSILLGEKDGGKNFRIKVSNLSNSYLELKNCFISTSSLSRQVVEIDGTKYSHIINPKTGSAINLHEAAIVISDTGYLGDILSTDFVNESLDSIKTLEAQFSVKTIIIDNGEISYKSEGIEVLKQ